MKLNYKDAFFYPFRGENWLKKFLIGGLAAFFPLTFPLAFGFFINSYRRLIHHDDDLPEWKDVMDIYSQGIIGLLIVLVYILPPFLLILIGYLLLGGGSGLITSTGAISFWGMIISMFILTGFLLLLFSFFLLPAGLAFYVDTLDFMDALKFPQIIKKVFDHIDKYCNLLIFYTCVMGASLSIFFFIFPFVIFYLHLLYGYVFSRYYIAYGGTGTE